MTRQDLRQGSRPVARQAGLLSGGLGWWLGALASVLVRAPEPFARRAVRLRPRADGFAVVTSDGTVRHHLSVQSPNRRVRAFVRRAAARYLDLDDETVLAVRATLPEAARNNLREAVALRMTELTPFTEDEVLFDLGQLMSHGGETVTVRVFIAPREVVADRMAELARLGVRVDAVIASDTGEATGAAIPNFAPEILRQRGAWLGLGLALACAVLLGGIGWLHQVATERQDRMREALQTEIAGALENVRQGKELDDEIAALSASLSLPQARRADQISTLAVLDGIAGALPDDAYLTGFRWADGQAEISGLAASASGLIGLLEASPILSEVRFSAPVARDPRLERDRFSITARATLGKAAE